MPALYDQGFSVRETPWHGLGEVYAEYPTREVAQHDAGHDYTVYEVEQPVARIPRELPPLDDEGNPTSTLKVDTASDFDFDELIVPGVKSLLAVYNDGRREMLPVVPNESFGIFQNDVAWDVVDALVGKVDQIRYETALKLEDGTHSVLAWLDEPSTIPGDDSEVYQWVNVSWGFKPGQPLSARATSVRTVCWNTQTMAEMQGKRTGLNYTFKHSKYVKERIADAMEAIRQGGEQHKENIRMMTELAAIVISPAQREEFVREFIFPTDKESILTDRVLGNVEASRQKLRQVWNSMTMPPAHELTAYGLMLAGGEYLDHIRGYRNTNTYFGRSMLTHEGEKAKMMKMIQAITKGKSAASVANSAVAVA